MEFAPLHLVRLRIKLAATQEAVFLVQMSSSLVFFVFIQLGACFISRRSGGHSTDMQTSQGVGGMGANEPTST